MKLQDVESQALRQLLGNRAFSAGGLAIHGTATENVRTVSTIEYAIKGVLYSRTVVASIDLSTLSGLSTTDLETAKTQVFALELDAAGAFTVVFGDQVSTADITSGDKEVDWPIASSDDKTIVGAVKVINASGAVFVLGTTDLDAAGITDTYYDLSVSSF